MNRRDIIIIAVLINTGLLSALVMMAINTDDQGYLAPGEFNQLLVDKTSPESPYEKESVLIAQNTTIATDEWDSVLKDYVNSGSSHMNLQDEDQPEEFEKEIEEPKKVVKEVPKVIVTKPIVQPAIKETKPFQPLVINKDKKSVEITVKRGDALEKIARANGTTIEEIRLLNQLKNDRLSVGQILLVPATNTGKVVTTQAKVESASVAKSPTVDEVEYYVIKSGDNPWKIAKQYKVKFDDLLRLNNLDEEKARNLKIGDRIRVK